MEEPGELSSGSFFRTEVHRGKGGSQRVSEQLRFDGGWYEVADAAALAQAFADVGGRNVQQWRGNDLHAGEGR